MSSTTVAGTQPASLRISGHRLARSVVVTVLGIALAAGLWSLLGPTALGGRASYVVTDGISMLPTFRADGLVVTRAEDSYRVGEVVAYHNLQLHAVVMHRIVAVHHGPDGDRFVMKGDNNDFRDDYHPRRSDVVGREWVYWAGAGRYLLWLHDPAFFAALLMGIALVALRPERRNRKRLRHGH